MSELRAHRPAMVEEVLELLRIPRGATMVDGTVGHGGHAAAMLQAAEGGELVAFDWDEEMLTIAENNLKNIKGDKTFVHSDYRQIPEWFESHRHPGADAILLDLGVNLQHFDDVARGFSFAADVPLDMRMDRSSKETASAWLNRASEGEIARVLREFGGEKWAGPIAAQIVTARRSGAMRTTGDLVSAVLRAIPAHLRDKRIHPATRTFQAIRIAVNRELEGLEEAIASIAKCLAPSGRMATLAYHSGEDAAVKNAFRKLASEGGFRLLTKKPLRATEAEVAINPNARSARLRAIERGAA